MSNNIDKKIAIALERLSRVFRIILWDLSSKEGLSPIQIHILLYINKSCDDICRVSRLAIEFGLAKATVSSAVKALVRKGFINRKKCEHDKRGSFLQLTLKGEALARKLSSWDNVINEQLAGLASNNKKTVLLFLMQLIESMKETGIIDSIRMCINCTHFQRYANHTNGERYHCSLTGKEALISELTFDCERHLYKDSIQRRMYA